MAADFMAGCGLDEARREHAKNCRAVSMIAREAGHDRQADEFRSRAERAERRIGQAPNISKIARRLIDSHGHGATTP